MFSSSIYFVFFIKTLRIYIYIYDAILFLVFNILINVFFLFHWFQTVKYKTEVTFVYASFHFLYTQPLSLYSEYVNIKTKVSSIYSKVVNINNDCLSTTLYYGIYKKTPDGILPSGV